MNFKFIHSNCVFMIATLFVFISCGCNNDGQSDSGEYQGGSSPKKIFQIMKQACKDMDWKTMFRCMDSDSQEFLAVTTLGMAVGLKDPQASGGGATGQEVSEEMIQLLKKHNLDQVAAVDLPEINAEDFEKQMSEYAEKIKDKPAFVAEFFSNVETEGGHANLVRPSGEYEGGLVDVEVDGDTAKGSVKNDQGNTPIRFIRQNGRWKINAELRSMTTERFNKING